MMNDFIHGDWTKIFAGYWSFLTCSYFGETHSLTIQQKLGKGPAKVVLVSKKGFCVCYYDKPGLQAFGRFLAEEVRKTPGLISQWCGEVKEKTDVFMEFMRNKKGKQLSPDDFFDFKNLFYAYVPPYVAVKQVLNFLPAEKTKELLPLFDENRLYTEHLWTEVEQLVVQYSKQVAEKTGYADHLIRCMTKEELGTYMQSGNLPKKEILEARFQQAAQLFEHGTGQTVAGDDVSAIEQQLLGSLDAAQVKGQCAYPGIVTGRVKIIFDPTKAEHFEKGDILVTGMTRPEYVPLMEKAAAIVTDAGGLLCHAAVVAREMKKPTIIGTEKATKVLKENDLVEIDAGKGYVRKI